MNFQLTNWFTKGGSNMSKKLLVMMVVMSSLFMQGCFSLSTVDAGHEGVMIYKPYIFGKGGVDETPIKAGAVWTVWSTEVERYSVMPVKYQEVFEDLTASDNVAIDFDMYLTLQMVKGKTPVLHEYWGPNFYVNNIKDVFRKVTRNEARTYTSIQLRTDEKIINTMQDNIMEEMSKYLLAEGLPIIVNKAITGKVVPPEEVLTEAAKTAAQKQKQKTEAQRYMTEKARKVAEGARALADKEYMRKLGMSADQFIRLKELDIIEGKENVTIYMGVSPLPIKQM